MSKHTQWIGADENGNFNPDHEWSVSNEDCAMSSSLPIWEGDEVIAFVVYRSDDWYKNEPKIVTDRARLIAAAPDLLEALQSILDMCNEDSHARDYASRQTEIRGTAIVALRKARGEQK